VVPALWLSKGHNAKLYNMESRYTVAAFFVDFNMDAIEEIYLDNWERFVELVQKDSNTTKYIYRGQSNSIDNLKFGRWSISSSFNRTYSHDNSFRFNSFISQQVNDDLFRIKYGAYKYREVNTLLKLDALSKCYFLQHYGVPTCFIDFTYNPLIALYFAISSLQGSSGGRYDEQGNCTSYSTSCNTDYISVYRLNYELLIKYLNIKSIGLNDFDIWLSSYELHLHEFADIYANVALDLNPTQRLHKEYSYNLHAQEGCFLLYDNRSARRLSFEEFLRSYLLYKSIEIDAPIITVYNIGYNSLYAKMKSRQPSSISIFKYLESQNITGKYLFDDIQGIKYDFNFFHQ
jgi:hypothetical protein